MKAHRRVVRVESKRLDSQILTRLACVASVPVRSERNGVFGIRAARKMGREQKGGRKGVEEGKEGNACPQTP